MNIDQMQLDLVKTKAEGFAYAVGFPFGEFEVVIPEESKDWGWNFRPEFNEVLIEAEIHSAEGCTVVYINENYEVVHNEIVSVNF
jgi:hypothetical protein